MKYKKLTILIGLKLIFVLQLNAFDIWRQTQLDSLNYRDLSSLTAINFHFSESLQDLSLLNTNFLESELRSITFYNFNFFLNKIEGLEKLSSKYYHSYGTVSIAVVGISRESLEYYKGSIDCEKYYLKKVSPPGEFQLNFKLPVNSSLSVEYYNSVSFPNFIRVKRLNLLNIFNLDNSDLGNIYFSTLAIYGEFSNSNSLQIFEERGINLGLELDSTTVDIENEKILKINGNWREVLALPHFLISRFIQDDYSNRIKLVIDKSSDEIVVFKKNTPHLKDRVFILENMTGEMSYVSEILRPSIFTKNGVSVFDSVILRCDYYFIKENADWLSNISFQIYVEVPVNSNIPKQNKREYKKSLRYILKNKEVIFINPKI